MLCGVDIVGIGEPENSALLDRIAAATGADPAGILVNRTLRPTASGS